MLWGDAEYISLLLVKDRDLQNYSNGHKKSIFTSVYYEIPNFYVSRMVGQLWDWLQIISNGQIMLCRKKFCHFFKAMHYVQCVHFED